MRILMVGDICGDAGRTCVQQLLPCLREELELDLVVANGENMARGIGITPRLAKDILAAGVDGITLGNHAFRQREILPYLNTTDTIVRPANFPDAAPGKGTMVLQADGVSVGVLNLMGSLFLDVAHGPFEVVDGLVEELRRRCDVVLVDFHAEATSEKVALGHHVDGAVTALVGTHTHVQTSDARLLAGGTAYMTDLGMTGPHDSVIGVKKEIILHKFRTGIGARFEPASQGVQLEGALLEVDGATGAARSITAVRVPMPADAG